MVELRTMPAQLAMAVLRMAARARRAPAALRTPATLELRSAVNHRPAEAPDRQARPRAVALPERAGSAPRIRHQTVRAHSLGSPHARPSRVYWRSHSARFSSVADARAAELDSRLSPAASWRDRTLASSAVALKSVTER